MTVIATLPSRSNPPRAVLIAVPGCRRAAAFSAALVRLGYEPAEIVTYVELLEGSRSLREVITPGCILKIESPGRDFDVERLMLAEGAESAEGGPRERLTREEAMALPFDRGRIVAPRQFHLGFLATLRDITRERSLSPEHHILNLGAEIALMFDKPFCHEFLSSAGVVCPRGLDEPETYEDLRWRMRLQRIPRVFLKLASGSSASGIMAIETSGSRVQCHTTIESVPGSPRLYNSRKIRRLTDEAEIARLADYLCRERAHAEQWIPKADFQGMTFDLRVVVIAGQARHVVMRCSRSPMTNLHLKNERGDIDALRAKIPATVWDAAMRSCELAASVVSGSLVIGVDLAFTPGFRGHFVLEINAFGDFLPGILHEGRDTYEWQWLAALERFGLAS